MTQTRKGDHVFTIRGIPQSFQSISICFCFNYICRLAEDWGYNLSGKFFEIYYNLTDYKLRRLVIHAILG